VTRSIEADKRSAPTPKPQPLDPVPALLRVDSEVLARLAALEAKLGRGFDEHGPTAARPPPAADTSIRVYTVRETAGILRLGLTRTYTNIVEGKIPAIKLGGRWLVPHDALVRLLADAARRSEGE
jgi:excisionase family DNA binding protein